MQDLTLYKKIIEKWEMGDGKLPLFQWAKVSSFDRCLYSVVCSDGLFLPPF